MRGSVTPYRVPVTLPHGRLKRPSVVVLPGPPRNDLMHIGSLHFAIQHFALEICLTSIELTLRVACRSDCIACLLVGAAVVNNKERAAVHTNYTRRLR